MPTPIPGPNAFAYVGGYSPHNQRTGVERRSFVIRDCSVANHSGLTGAPTAWGTGILPEGTIMQKATDGLHYAWGVTLPTTSPVTIQQFLTLSAGGVPSLSILIDPIDTTINGAGNPIITQAYFSGDFILSFVQVFGSQVIIGNEALLGFLRLNDIIIEGTTQVIPGTYPGTNYGQSVPRESAPF